MADGPDKPLHEIYIPRAWLAGMVVALLALVGLGVGFFAAANDNDTCGWCHVIKGEADSYRQSAHGHAGVQCQDCHTKPGVFNYFIRNIAAVSHIVENISGNYDQPVTTYVGAENCVECHPKEEIEKDIVVGAIRVNHKGLREAGYQCVTCHATIAHGDAIPTGTRPPDSIMSVCWQCHNGKDQSQRCSICHLNGVPPGSVAVTMPLHMSDRDCSTCHTQRSCSKCHNGLTMPHPRGWGHDHGGVVVDRGARICADCHTDKHPRFCSDCHGLAMPHPGTWEQTHGATAEKKPATCAKCHGQGSCDRCHGLAMPHPAGWVSSHPSTAQASPSLCGRCHSSSFCTSCHGVPLPHGSAFIDNHWTYAARWGTVCVKCHGNAGGGPSSCYNGECHTGGSRPN